MSRHCLFCSSKVLDTQETYHCTHPGDDGFPCKAPVDICFGCISILVDHLSGQGIDVFCERHGKKAVVVV